MLDCLNAELGRKSPVGGKNHDKFQFLLSQILSNGIEF